MSLKNLRKNTQLIKYLKILHKRTKKVDTIDNFAVAMPSSAVDLVRQPCLNKKKEEVFEMQDKCAPGWTSVDDSTGERLSECSRQPGAQAPLPKCEKKSNDDRLKKHEASISSKKVNLQSVSDNLKMRIEKSLQTLTKRYKATRSGSNITDKEAKRGEPIFMGPHYPQKRRPVPYVDAGRTIRGKDRPVTGINYIPLGSKQFIDMLKGPLYSAKGITPEHVSIFNRFFDVYDKAKDVMAGTLTKMPYPKLDAQDPKSRIIEEMAFDDIDKIEYVMDVLESPALVKEHYKGFFKELGTALKSVVLKAVIDDRIRISRQGQPKEAFTDGYCNFVDIGQRNIFSMGGDTKFLRGDSTVNPQTGETVRESLKDAGAPLENFGHAPSMFTEHLFSKLEYTRKMDESLYKLAKETYIYTDNAADLYKSQGTEDEPGYRAIGSSTQAGLRSLLNTIRTRGMESTLAPKLEGIINDLDDFFDSIDGSISGLNAKQRKVLSRRFNDKMNSLYSTIHEIAEEEISSTRKRTYFGIHTYTTYFAEFHTAVDAILSKDSEGVLVPTSTSYPLGDVHKVVRNDGQTGHEMRITFVSTKNGFGSNDSSLSAIAAVKFLGETSYYRHNAMSQKVRTTKAGDGDTGFAPATTLEDILVNFDGHLVDSDGHLDFELLTAGDENNYLLPRPKTTSTVTDPTTGQQVQRVDTWNSKGVGAEIVLRTSKDDSLFVRPGSKLSLEEFYDTLLKMRDESDPHKLEILASKLVEADGKDISKLDMLKEIIKKTRFKDKPDTFNFLDAFIDDVLAANSSNDNIDTIKYFRYSDFSKRLVNSDKMDFQTNASGNVQLKVDKLLADSLKYNNIGARKIQNTWKSQFYELFPTVANMPDSERNALLNSIFPSASEAEDTQWFGQDKTAAEKRTAAATLNTRYKQRLSAYLGDNTVYDRLQKGAKVYEVFEGVSATNLKYQYANEHKVRTQEMLNAFPVDPQTGTSPKIGNVASDPRVQRYLKDLNSGLNLQDKTLTPALRETYDKFLNELTFQELDTLVQIHNVASGTSKKAAIPLGTTGARVLQVVASNLGLFDGDEQFLILSNKIKSKETEDESRTKDIEKHFGVCSMESEIKPDGLINKLKQNTPLNLSEGQLLQYMKDDFKLDDHNASRFLEYIGAKQTNNQVSALSNQELLKDLQDYISVFSNSPGSVLTLKTNLDSSSTVTKYNSGKENVGSYASLGLKASPYGMAAYFAHSQGGTFEEQRSIYHTTTAFLEKLAGKSRDALAEVLRTSVRAQNFKETKPVSALKKYYLRLLRKRTLSFADDGIGSVVQPCAYKDSTGKITGVGSYERKRACYNGWTSIGTGAHANSCMPSSGSAANFRYPTCPKQGAEQDDSDSTLGGRLAVEVSTNPRFQTEEGFGGLLDAIGAKIYKKALENPTREKIDETGEHLNYLQAFQTKLLDKIPLEDIKNSMQDIEDYEVYISDLEDEGKEPTPEELEKYDVNKYLYHKYETYLENSSARIERDRMFKVRKEKEKGHRKLLMKLVKDGKKDKLYNPQAIEPKIDKTSLKYFYKSSYGDTFIDFEAQDITRYIDGFSDLDPIKTLLKNKKAKMAIDIGFLVNGSYGMPEEALTRLEKLEAAQVLQRVFEDTIKRAPVGAVFVNHPYNMDGYEAHAQRINNYKTMGFDLLDPNSNAMAAIKTKDGTIAPLNTQNMSNFKEKTKPNYETLFDAFFGSSSVVNKKNSESTEAKPQNFKEANSALKKYYIKLKKTHIKKVLVLQT